MRNYEFMFIVKPVLEDEATKAVCESMKKVLVDNGAKVTDVKNMGRRELAYEINTFKNGNYFLISFEGDTNAVKELARVANINENIIRHLVVNKEK